MNRDLMPFGSYPYPWVREEDPLSVLSKTNPSEVAPILWKQLEIRKVEARADCLKSISSDQAKMVCAWLQTRDPDQKGIVISGKGGSSERGLFPQGEVGGFITEVSILYKKEV